MDAPQPVTQPKRLTMESVGKFFKDSWRDYLLLLGMGTTIVGFDQWTKAWVRANVPLGGDWLPSWLGWLEPYARVRYWYNSGAAFGLFQEGNLIFTTLAIVVALVIIYYFPRVARTDWWLRIAMGMQFAGAVGNLVDRLFFKHVTDFLSVGSFAVFNVADSSISVGVAVLVVGAWITDRAAKKKAGAARTAETPLAEPAADQDEAKGE
jgi:signal peptidase II